MLVQLQKNFSKDVAIVFRHFPLPMHDKAMLAAQAAEAAGLQDKAAFFKMKEMFANKFEEWTPKPVAEFKTWVTAQAKGFGLDEAKFTKDMESEAIINKIKKMQKDAEQVVSYTPFLLINGYPAEVFGVGNNYEGLTKMVEMAQKLDDIKFKECPPMTVDPAKQYEATLKTSKGDVVFKLFPDKAPLAVNSFIFLAKKGWYDNVPFHRVIPKFVAQAGDPTGLGIGGPGYVYDNEISPDLKYDKAGRVGVANAGPNTNGSQFFITYDKLPNLDGKYTIFAEVIRGMDVAEKLTARDASQQKTAPADPDTILSITIEEK